MHQLPTAPLPPSRSWLITTLRAAVPVLGLAAVVAGCASLRQNMRGQELSYRGAWYCEVDNCDAGDLSQSRSGTRDGEVMVNTVKLAPRAAMMFTAASPFDSLTAVARDCKGNNVDVPAADIIPAGDHGVGDGDAKESWVVWIDPASLTGLEHDTGACKVWKVEATATWSDGATYKLMAGLDIDK